MLYSCFTLTHQMEQESIRVSRKAKCRIDVRVLYQNQPPEVFYKKTGLKIFAIFTGKHLCWSLFLITFLAILLKETQTQVFFCEYFGIFKKIYFVEHLQTAASIYLLVAPIKEKNWVCHEIVKKSIFCRCPVGF